MSNKSRKLGTSKLNRELKIAIVNLHRRVQLLEAYNNLLEGVLTKLRAKQPDLFDHIKELSAESSEP